MDAPTHNWGAYGDVYRIVGALHPQSYDYNTFGQKPSVLYDDTFEQNKNQREFTYLFRIHGRQVRYREEGGVDHEFKQYLEKNCAFQTAPKYTLTKQTVQIGYQQAAKFGAENTVVIPRKLIDGALGLYVPLVANYLRMRFRSVDEVVPRLNPSTACGWPVSSKFRIKHDFLRIPIWRVSYTHYFATMSKPSYPPSIYTSNVKFEMRTYAKVIDDESRTFMPCPMFTQLLWMQYFSAYDDSIAETAEDTPFCLGFSDKYGGTDRLARELLFAGVKEKNETVEFLEWDVTGWDRNTQIAMLKMGMEAMEMNFPPEYRTEAHKQRIQNMFHDMVYTPVLMELGDTFQTHNGVKSGHPGTLTVNSVMHIMMILCALVWMKPDITSEEVRKCFRFKVQGDDGLGSRIVQRTPWFSKEKLRQFVEICGYVFKHLRSSFKLEDLEFIGGNIVPTEYGVYVLRPNRLKIIDSLVWHKNVDPRCVLSKLLSLKVLSYPDGELYKFLCGYSEWYWKKHDRLLRIPLGETVDGEPMFTYRKLKSQDLTESAIRKIFYGFQMDEAMSGEELSECSVQMVDGRMRRFGQPICWSCHPYCYDTYYDQIGGLRNVRRCGKPFYCERCCSGILGIAPEGNVITEEGFVRRYGEETLKEVRRGQAARWAANDRWKVDELEEKKQLCEQVRSVLIPLNGEAALVSIVMCYVYESYVAEPRSNDNIRNKEDMSAKQHKFPSQKAKAGLITKAELKVARKAERKVKKERKRAAKAGNAPAATTNVVAALKAEIKAESKAASAKGKGKGPGKGPKPGYLGVFNESYDMTRRKNHMVQTGQRSKDKYGIDRADYVIEGNWQGVTLTSDAATPPTLVINGTLQTLRINPYTLGPAVANEAQNWEEYCVKGWTVWADPLGGITNTTGLIHVGIAEDSAYLVASGQTVTKDYVDTLRWKAVWEVYNQTKPVKLVYRHDSRRTGREYYKVYQSSQTISSAPVVAEVRECYQMSFIAFPQTVTASVELMQFQTITHISFRGWKTPVALVRDSIENAANAVIRHKAGQLVEAHAEYHARKRAGEKVEEPPLLFNPDHSFAVLAEIQRYAANYQYLSRSESKTLAMLVGVYNAMQKVRMDVIQSVSALYPKQKEISVSADVPVSAIPVVVVDPSVATDARLANLASAARVSNTGTLQTTGGGGPSGVQDVRIMNAAGTFPVSTINSSNATTGHVFASAPLLNNPALGSTQFFVQSGIAKNAAGGGGYTHFAPPFIATDSNTAASNTGELVMSNTDKSLSVGGGGVTSVGGAGRALLQYATGQMASTQISSGASVSAVINSDGSLSVGGGGTSAAGGSGRAFLQESGGKQSAVVTGLSAGPVAINGPSSGGNPVPVWVKDNSNTRNLNVDSKTGNLYACVTNTAATNVMDVTSGGSAYVAPKDDNGHELAINSDGSIGIAGSTGVVVPSGANNALKAFLGNPTGSASASVNADGSVKVGGSNGLTFVQAGTGGQLISTIYDGATPLSVNSDGSLNSQITTISTGRVLDINVDGSIRVGGTRSAAFQQSTAGTMFTIVATAASSTDAKTESVGSEMGPGSYLVPADMPLSRVQERVALFERSKPAKRSSSVPKSVKFRRVFSCCGQAGEVAGDTYTCPECKKVSTIVPGPATTAVNAS